MAPRSGKITIDGVELHSETAAMTAQEIAAALRRVEAVVERRPDFAMHEEAPATARWEGGTRVVASHANGARVATDMPPEFGGAGNDVTPGWLFRAGFASCTAACIAMGAAAKRAVVRASRHQQTVLTISPPCGEGAPKCIYNNAPLPWP